MKEKLNDLGYLPFSLHRISVALSLFTGWASFQYSLVSCVSKCLCSRFSSRLFDAAGSVVKHMPFGIWQLLELWCLLAMCSR